MITIIKILSVCKLVAIYSKKQKTPILFHPAYPEQIVQPSVSQLLTAVVFGLPMISARK